MTTREPGASEVFTAALTVRPRSTAFLASEAGGDHDGRIAGVGAARDRGDEDAAVLELDIGRRAVVPLSVTTAWRLALVLFAEAIFRDRLVERGEEFLLELGQRDAVLRTLRAGHAGRDVGEVELEIGAVDDAVRLGRDAEQFLRLEVGLERLDLRRGAAGGPEVVDRFGIDGEVAHGRAVLGGHVGDGRAVGQRKRGGAGAVELDELADDLLLAQHLGDVEREIGRGDAFAQRAGHVDADDFGREEVDRLAEHARLRLDAAHAPADDAEAVDHGGVRIGADERVGIINRLAVDLGGEDALGEVLEIDLVDDADAGRDDLEGLERLLAPLEEFVALAVAGEFEFEVAAASRRHVPATSTCTE